MKQMAAKMSYSLILDDGSTAVLEPEGETLPTQERLRDKFGRAITDLRVSVTDRCNLRCRYCMPREVYGAGFAYLAREEILSYEEIERLVRVLAGLGVERVRLTGGEPLLRRGLERLVEMLVRIEGIREVSLTTNGVLLAHRARALKQ